MNPSPWSTDYLIEIAESANIPDYVGGQHGRVVYVAKDGWKVHTYWHCDQMEFVEDWETPGGEFINTADWPEVVDDEYNADKWRLDNWHPGSPRGVSAGGIDTI